MKKRTIMLNLMLIMATCLIASGSWAKLSFGFDVASITFIYGGNAGRIYAEARNVGGGVVDSF